MRPHCTRILLLTAMMTLLVGQAVFSATLPATRADVPRITVSELNNLLKHSDPVVIDTRTPGQWNQATQTIPHARRLHSQTDLQQLVKEVAPDTPIVTYCT